MAKKLQLKHLILDVDGVFTTGQFLYTNQGKFSKIFGAHDNDGIKLIKPLIDIHAVSADQRGFSITKKRIADDMKLKLELVPEGERLIWMKKNFNLAECAYMGDGINDAAIFDHVAYSIAPANAFYLARDKADFVTTHRSGEGAVAEACLHLIKKFFSKK